MKCRERKQISACRGLGAEETGVTTNGYGASFWLDENVLELNTGDGCTAL